MTDRTILTLTGADRVDFLQGLVTNDVTKDGLIYAALLTPQGKFIADFFVLAQPEAILIDVASSHAPTLFQRLSMYRLRADVQITESPLIASCGTGTPPPNSHPDPRHPALGWRSYSDTDISDTTDWDAIRVSHLIPETGVELTPDTYILEAGFEAIHGIDFKKGCYVGQEIAARMKHKTDLKKGLRRVTISGPAAAGQGITSNDKPAGTLYTISGDHGIAYLRDNRTESMKTATAQLHLAP